MKITLLLSLLLTASLLFCSACAKEEQQGKEECPSNVIYLHDLYTEINENALPPLDTSYREPIYIEGRRVDGDRMKRAPQDLVGTSVNLSVNVLDWSDNSNKELLYCFKQQENGKGKLWVLYSIDPVSKDAIMLTMETEYATAEMLLSETEVWSGMVTSISLVCYLDYMLPSQTVAGAEREFEQQSAAGPICYGSIAITEADTPMERVCFSCDSMDEISPFKITFERFGVLGT